jgi:hypothetical protein
VWYLDIVSVSEIGKLYQEKDYFRQLLKTAIRTHAACEELIFKWRHMQLYQMRMMFFANDLLGMLAANFLLFCTDGKT